MVTIPLRFLFLLMLLFTLGCGDKASSPPTAQGEPESCTEGETQTATCGVNGRGTQSQICTDGEWEDDGACEDDDVCVDDKRRNTSCGPDDAGLQPQVCVAGQWEDDGACVEGDACPEGTSREVSCGLNDRGTQQQVCEDGEWEDDGACDDTDVCTDGEERNLPCARGDAGERLEVCTEGRWSEGGECACSDASKTYDAIGDACLEPIACDEEDGPFGGGAGTEEDPYRICSAAHLQAVGGALDAHFVLAQSLDLSEVENFEPIGSEETPFLGVFDGKGRTLRDLKLLREGEDDVGLFRRVGSSTPAVSGFVRDLSLVNFVVEGAGAVGALAGRVQQSSSVTERVHVIGGQVTGTGDLVGGLVGWHAGKVQESSASASVTGRSSVGGLVGVIAGIGSIRECSATGTVTGSGNIVGGLVGQNSVNAIVQESFATGAVTGGVLNTGGLVGFNGGTLQTSSAAGVVTGGDRTGGLAGTSTGTVMESSASGTVKGATYVGGLVGYNNNTGMVQRSFASGAVSCGPVGVAGGLIGRNDGGTVEQSYATGDVQNGRDVGGLVGSNDGAGTVQESYAMGAVTGTGEVGGLVGINEGSVSTAFALQQADSSLVGLQDGTVDAVSGLLTAAELATQETFTAEDVEWDFDDVWLMAPDRPLLQWQDE